MLSGIVYKSWQRPFSLAFLGVDASLIYSHRMPGQPDDLAVRITWIFGICRRAVDHLSVLSNSFSN